ncbi:glycosyltransferase family 2 protein, partial [Heyndrickxia shackletonii]|uniref:glycosyltransferase family 2 protein n=1 Tax=Heyndrickxia shackletonii TaxID=157838 RepID=UPI000AB7B856
MKITVIIPVFNTEEFLPECIESVINQTYENIEIIIVDDASTDNSNRIINEYSKMDERIKISSFTERKGVGAARNFGLRQSTGEYVYFLDSDDFIESATLQKLIENIRGYKIISGRQKIVKKHNDIFQKENNDKGLLFKDRFRHFGGMSIIHHLISKEFILANNLTFTENVHCYTELPIIISLLKGLYKCQHKYVHFRLYKNVQNYSFSFAK